MKQDYWFDFYVVLFILGMILVVFGCSPMYKPKCGSLGNAVSKNECFVPTFDTTITLLNLPLIGW